MPAVRAELRGLAAAVAFLTRVPVGRWVDLGATDVARGGALFPLVGAGIGAVVGGVVRGLAGSLTPLLAAALGLAVGTVLTGALHLDGLADTADALGATTRDRALEIMRDHTIGAYGTVALILDLLIKAGALAALENHEQVLRLVIAAGALSRSTPVLLAAFLPYARPGGGTGASLSQAGRLRAAVAAGVALAIAVAVAGIDGLVVAACAAAVAVPIGFAARRWLGGITGDTLGAALELTEILVLVVGVALVAAG